jgi:hypothetical protein
LRVRVREMSRQRPGLRHNPRHDVAVVDGGFAMRKDGLQVVLKAMGAAGINMVAIHQHMTEEPPRYVFLHYWSKAALSTSRRASRAPSMHKPVCA